MSGARAGENDDGPQPVSGSLAVAAGFASIPLLTFLKVARYRLALRPLPPAELRLALFHERTSPLSGHFPLPHML
jgi:hypothetical protein